MTAAEEFRLIEEFQCVKERLGHNTFVLWPAGTYCGISISENASFGAAWAALKLLTSAVQIKHDREEHQ